jgi:outer membrane lipoprotein-sorting protein
MRQITVLLLALVAAPAYAQDKDAENLYRAMEKKTRSAKTMHFVFDGEATGMGLKGSMKGEVHLAEGEKANITIQGNFGGNAMNMTVISDGKKVYAKVNENVDVKDNDPKEKHVEQALGMVARLGILAAFRSIRGPGAEDSDIDKFAPIKDFKLGAKEKLGKQDTPVVQYEVNLPDGVSAKVSVWIDTATRLPVKREMAALKGGNEEMRITENYTTFTVDGKIDPKLFELPK